MVALRSRLLLLLITLFAPWMLNQFVQHPTVGVPAAPFTSLQTSVGMIQINEVETNNTAAQANLLATDSIKVVGNIFPVLDVDMFAINAQAGDRLYAATMTSFGASSQTDSLLDVLASDGTTVLESDNDDGSLSTLSSSIAGVTLPTDGIYYIRIKYSGTGTTNSSTLRPYELYVNLEHGAPVAEIEPNAPTQPQALPVSGYVTGTLGVVGDTDSYTLTLPAGATIFASLDLNPERDGNTWNGRLGIGTFNGSILVVNDGSTTSPNSEAFFLTVKESGTYLLYVDASTTTVGGPSFTYNLSVGVLPAPIIANCHTYVNSGTTALGPNISTSLSSITVPDDLIIDSITTTIVLTHTAMPDLDVMLTAPDGNQVGLFNDIGATTSLTMNTTLDDQAGYVIGSFNSLTGTVVKPRNNFRLSWFKGQHSAGTWTLTLADDTTSNGGTLQNWSITLCGMPASAPECAEGTLNTLFSTDFEASDGGFTHSGTGDVWQWGAPSAAPITHTFSGVNAWKTNLTGLYPASASMDLLSPAIDLSSVDPNATVYVRWYQTYQMESASYDNYDVTAIMSGTTNITLFQFLDSTMTATIGTPTIQERAGWARVTAAVPVNQASNLQLRFHVNSDNTVQLAGAAIDDVLVYTCSVAATATPTPTDTPTSTPTGTPPTDTPTSTATDTPTNTPTSTVTNTPTSTVTNTPTSTPTSTATNTPTSTATNTPTSTATNTPTNTPTSTPTAPTSWQIFVPLIIK